ncbi:retrovirus-related pol polyprotein from transposon TNT 1-94 [Tanacetum coccineum]
MRIRSKLVALYQEIDTLKETLSNNVKEKETLSKTLTVFKTESKEKESKYIDKEIVLEKQNKELENIICKMYRSTQAMHMLTKPQVFYDDTHKQDLGYQNMFHLKKAQRIQPTLYDGSVIAKEHAVISVIDDEETLILEEESRSKMLNKQNDLISIEKKIKISLIDYSKLNKIKEDFGKRFVTQKELSAEQVLKDTFNAFDKTLLDEITKVQTVFNQIEAAVDQCSVDNNVFEIQIKQLWIDNDQLLNQIISQEIVHIVANSVDILDVKKSCVNNSIFQRENSGENLNAPTFNQLFKINELKVPSQENDTVIRKFKERFKSLSGKDSVKNVKNSIDEIETINIELEHSVAKLLSGNENLRKEREHLKSIYKDQFDSIRKTRVQSKEHCDSLIAQINAKSVKNSDLNAQLQEKVFAITALKNELRKLKGKNIVNSVVSKLNATLAPGIFKLDIEPISPRLKNNRDAHEVYIDKTIEYTDTLRGFVERARTQYPSEPLLESTCMFTKHVQEFASGSKPSGNTKNNRISRPPCSNQKNKVEDHLRKVKSSLNKTNSIFEPISNALVKHSVRNAKFESIYAICNKCLFDANHDMCLVDFVNDVNDHFQEIVHLKETTPKSVETPKPDIKVYSRRPKQIKSVGSSKKAKIVEFKIANNSKPTHLWGSNATDVPSSSSLVNDRLSRSSSRTVRFGNDQVTKIIGYGDYQQGNIILSRVYYIEGLIHNLFFVRQFCDADLEVSFWKNTCFIRNLERVDLLSGSRDTNLYIISLDDMLKTSSISLLSKTSKTKSWLWHRHLSHLNFACALGKSKKSSHQSKAEDTNQEKLYLLHMDLCGSMRVESINGKKYILVIVDDYSRFTWVKFLRSKDEAPDALIKCIKNIQVRLNATVRNIRTDNRTEFVNQTLRDFYENVGISHQTSVARTPQQNGAEAINTTCYTKNRSLIRLRYNKTPYELMYDKKPDLSFFHVFGSLCYPTNDSEDLGKLNTKADIGPGFQVLTPATSSSGLVPNIIPQKPCNLLKRDDWDTLFQPLFDEYINPLTIDVSTVLVAAAPRPVSTSIDQDAPSSSIPSTQDQEHSPIIS